jgi:DNA-binding CsgD family transcriptional regulator
VTRNLDLPIKTLQLSPREAEVLTWTACGKTGGEISEFLSVSEETVRAHIKSACHKLGAANKTHATAIALIHGVLAPGPYPERVIPLSVLFGLSKSPLDQRVAKQKRVDNSDD